MLGYITTEPEGSIENKWKKKECTQTALLNVTKSGYTNYSKSND